jgi:Bacteriophage translational regulator
MISITDLVEVTLGEKDDFLKVRETLTRIGVASKKDRILYQSCHILHKQGHYYITHFKELFALDGKPTDISENDLSRRNAIAKLLQDWGLVKVVNIKQIEEPPPIFLSQIKILSHKEKDDWELVPKYNIGSKKATY